MEENGVIQNKNEEKQPRFINDSPFTLETIRKANKHLKNLIIIVFALGALSFLNYFLLDGDFLLLFCGISTIVCGFASLYSYRLQTVRNPQVADNAHHVYKFYEEEIDDVFLYGEEPHGGHRIAYSQLTKVFKLNGFIFLQLGGMGYLVDPNGFILGTEEELIAFLKEKRNPKVVKIKDKK